MFTQTKPLFPQTPLFPHAEIVPPSLLTAHGVMTLSARVRASFSADAMRRSSFSTPRINPWAVVRLPSRRKARRATHVSNGKSVRNRPCRGRPMANESERAGAKGRAEYEIIAIRNGTGNGGTHAIVAGRGNGSGSWKKRRGRGVEFRRAAGKEKK